MKIDWKSMKSFIDKTKLYNFINYLEFDDNTYVWIAYQNENFNTLLDRSTVDFEDFTNNYKSKAILKNDISGDGTSYAKVMHVTTGRLLKALFVEFKTSSLINNDVTGNIRQVMFDENNNITKNSQEAVKTAIDFMPAFTYEVYGGGIQSLEPVVNNYYVSGLFAPNIPKPYGNVDLVINKRIMSAEEDFFINGIGTSQVTYDAQMLEASVMRIIVSHPKGDIHDFQIQIQYYA